MFAWTPRGDDSWGPHREAEYLRRAAIASYRVSRAKEPDRLWELIVEETCSWLYPTAVRAYSLPEPGTPELVIPAAVDVPPDAALMEAALLLRAPARGRSLISNHPMIDPDLAGLSARLGLTDSVVHVMLLRAYRETHGAVAIHWIGKPRPTYDRRSGFLAFWDDAGLAVAKNHERQQLERAAFHDTKTGLPNQAALERELARHASTLPLGVLVADFDGMREANAAFDGDFARGGDVLVRAVGAAIRTFAQRDEFACRMNTAGDEFCLLIPGADATAAEQRARELETVLDTLDVPVSHRHVYRGASVGGVSRAADETPGQTLGRAATAMRERKLQRRAA